MELWPLQLKTLFVINQKGIFIMFYTIKAKTSPIYNSIGEFIPFSERKYSVKFFQVFSQDKRQVLRKAGKCLAVHGLSHDGIKILGNGYGII